jgi:hypothetical protein
VILPPALVYAAWRYEVNVPLAGTTVHELLPFKDWQYWNIPVILRQMSYVAALKGGFFGLILLLAGRAAWGLVHRSDDNATKITLITTIVFIGYTAFLVLVYIALFIGKEGVDVQSYWRFNTQLGPLALLAAVTVVAPHWKRRVGGLPAPGAAGLVLICLGAPFAFLPTLRVDLHSGQPRIWAIGRDLGQIVPAHARLDVVMPGDNGDLSELMEGVLTQVHPRRTDIVVTRQNTVHRLPREALIWLSCASSQTNNLLRVDARRGSALLLKFGSSGWQAIHAWDKGVCAGAAKAARKRALFNCVDVTLRLLPRPSMLQTAASLKAEAGYFKFGLARLWCKTAEYY